MITDSQKYSFGRVYIGSRPSLCLYKLEEVGTELAQGSQVEARDVHVPSPSLPTGGRPGKLSSRRHRQGQSPHSI